MKLSTLDTKLTLRQIAQVRDISVQAALALAKEAGWQSEKDKFTGKTVYLISPSGVRDYRKKLQPRGKVLSKMKKEHDEEVSKNLKDLFNGWR